MIKKIPMIAIVVLIAFMLAGCCIEGSGDIEKETHTLSTFSKIHVEIPGDVTISEGDKHRVTVRTDDNVIDRIDMDVRKGTLYIDLNPSTCIDPTTLRVAIQMAEIEKLIVEDSADVTFKDEFEGESLKMVVEGSGDITSKETLRYDAIDVVIEGSGDVALDMDTPDLLSIIEGSGDIKYSGIALVHNIDIEGSGDISAYNLETDEAQVEIEGSGSCKLSVTETLDINIEGSGDVYYRGTPEVSKKLSGSGSVKKTD